MLIRSGEAPGVGWSRIVLYSGFITLPRSVVRRQTGFAARITRTLSASIEPDAITLVFAVALAILPALTFTETHNTMEVRDAKNLDRMLRRPTFPRRM